MAQLSWVMICGLLTLRNCFLLASNFLHGIVSILLEDYEESSNTLLDNGRVEVGEGRVGNGSGGGGSGGWEWGGNVSVEFENTKESECLETYTLVQCSLHPSFYSHLFPHPCPLPQELVKHHLYLSLH